MTWQSFPYDIQHDGVEWRECHVEVTDDLTLLVHGWNYADRRVEQRAVVKLNTRPTLPNPFAPRYASALDLDTEAGPFTGEKSSGCACQNPLKHSTPAQLAVTG